MTRQTSIEAYNKIKENGLLSKRRFQFYHVIFNYGPLTANEACKLVEKEFNTKLSSSGIGSRLSELKKQTVITEVGRREDSKTGMKNILYDVTANTPTPIKNEKRAKQMCLICQGRGYRYEFE